MVALVMPESRHLDVLYEDNHLLVVNKPAMLPTMGVAADKPSLLTLAKDYIRRKYNKPGNVYLGVVSRLDAPVTGVLVIAKRSKAASRLTASFKERKARKVYWAVISGTPDEKEGTLEHYMRKDERHRKMHVTHPNAPEAKLARLNYRCLAAGKQLTLVEVHLETGRKHQIRVQFAKMGHAIVGDRKYGSEVPFPQGIALHSRLLELEHPIEKEVMCFEKLPPQSWQSVPAIAKMLAETQSE